MNTKQFIAALAVVLTAGASFNALAGGNDSPKTRAQVLAELEQARADGSFYIEAGDGTPRGLARARLAQREEQSRRARADAADTRAADAATQRAGS